MGHDMSAKNEIIPDKDALARVGESVRKRLKADPQVYQVETDKAEIFAIGDFLSAEECKRLCTMIDLVAKPSTLHEQDYASGFRTSYSGDLDPSDSFVKSISRRIDDLLGMAPKCGEAIQGQRYLPGQQFKPHNDWFYTSEKYWELERKRGGQRCWTAMAFLNEVEEGGETHFTEVGIKIEPKPGVLLVWNNALPDGTPNEGTIHAGTPVLKGAKYVITKWYRTREWK
ncbi:eukaryotic peptidyl prolyl 4-hydroxylase alpha subunit-like protein [Altererythrobacter epoxidivorans]|uniref:Eukaryotic peptidyl prolyl 4-hydroxylase alpha subunit-like protein n=2 Tax=Altererythrobacter epoxidivorans TaxID=361183 RepID=A0A0M5KY83_9SPHN|nr:eukaryotic peptidyl prolyl 4-hydroxylase alpha subunit-like protein [Altererythrobacter epoxidivorans]